MADVQMNCNSFAVLSYCLPVKILKSYNPRSGYGRVEYFFIASWLLYWCVSRIHSSKQRLFNFWVSMQSIWDFNKVWRILFNIMLVFMWFIIAVRCISSYFMAAGWHSGWTFSVSFSTFFSIGIFDNCFLCFNIYCNTITLHRFLFDRELSFFKNVHLLWEVFC